MWLRHKDSFNSVYTGMYIKAPSLSCGSDDDVRGSVVAARLCDFVVCKQTSGQ
jgi:hypothetical protein